MKACEKCKVDGGTVDKVGGEISMKNRAKKKDCLNFPLPPVQYTLGKMHSALFTQHQAKKLNKYINLCSCLFLNEKNKKTWVLGIQ